MESADTVSVSNAASGVLEIFIEPWCDSLDLGSRSTVAFQPVALPDTDPVLPELTIDGDMLVVWAGGPGTLIVSIDGMPQDTGSLTVNLEPEMFDMPVKQFVETVFAGFPQARPGGRPPPLKRSFWKWLLGR